MATSKEYAYYLKGNKVAIVQKDYTSSGGQTLSQPGLNDLGNIGALYWKSPKESITDGLELQYVYSPFYNYQNTSSITLSSANASGATAADTYLLGILDGAEYVLGYSDIGVNSTASFVVDDYIVVRDNPVFNGLHKVKSSSFRSNTTVTFHTKLKPLGLNGIYLWQSSQDYTNEIHLGTIYTAVNAMEDETFDIDVTRYQANAVTYYVKAKYAEDAGNIEMKEYFMREFRRMVEKHESSKIIGPRILQGYSHFR